MDTFTKQIHYLISASIKSGSNGWPDQYLLTDSDVYRIAALTNKVCEVVIGEKLLKPRKSLWNSAFDSIDKLVENGDIVVKPFDEMEEIARMSPKRMEHLYSYDEIFILDKRPVVEWPMGISPDKVKAIQLSISAYFLSYIHTLFALEDFVKSLEWAVDVRTERLGFISKRQELQLNSKRGDNRNKQKIKREKDDVWSRPIF